MNKVVRFTYEDVQMMIGLVSTIDPEMVNGRDADAAKAVIYKTKSMVENKEDNNLHIPPFEVVG